MFLDRYSTSVFFLSLFSSVVLHNFSSTTCLLCCCLVLEELFYNVDYDGICVLKRYALY